MVSRQPKRLTNVRISRDAILFGVGLYLAWREIVVEPEIRTEALGFCAALIGLIAPLRYHERSR